MAIRSRATSNVSGMEGRLRSSPSKSSSTGESTRTGLNSPPVTARVDGYRTCWPGLGCPNTGRTSLVCRADERPRLLSYVAPAIVNGVEMWSWASGPGSSANAPYWSPSSVPSVPARMPVHCTPRLPLLASALAVGKVQIPLGGAAGESLSSSLFWA